MTETSNGDSEASVVEQGKEQVQQTAGQLGDRIQQTTQQQVDQRSTEAGEKVQSLSSDLRSVGDRLREDGNDGPAKLADQVADRAERVGGYLTESDAQRILGDVEDAVRRQPWLALAGGIALGVAAARVLKASSSSRYHGQSSPSVTSQSEATREIPAATPASPPTPAPQGTPVAGVGMA